MFWSISAAVLFAAALITLSPLMRAKSLWQPFALAMVFLLPGASLWIYNEFGTPAAIGLRPPPPATVNPADPHASNSSEMDAMIANLRSRLTNSPEDLDGWILLARTLKATQQYHEAALALETANRISPDNPQVLVELVETRIFLTPDGRITGEMVATLERVLEIQPEMQKALWLMGIASSQAGDIAFAISYWQALLKLLEPGGGAARAVQAQIEEAQAEMGMTVDATPVVVEDPGSWRGLQLRVLADASVQSDIPPGGVLYVMVRSPGTAMGPPLGVRRIVDPALPQDITITDRDSMIQGRQISSESEVQLQARISLSGSPTASPGDWQSEPLAVELGSGQAVELVIDQQVE